VKFRNLFSRHVSYANPGYESPNVREETTEETAKTAKFFETQIQARKDERIKLSQAPRQQLTMPDLELAGYVAGRSIDGRPVDDDLLDLLKRVNDGNAKTHERLHLGRANVEDDVKRTARKGHFALQAMRSTWEAHAQTRSVRLHETPKTRLPVYASVMASAGAGNCGEHALVGMRDQAAHLQPGETLTMLKVKSEDHVFNQIKSGDIRVNGDAWAYGPAHESVDGEFTNSPEDTIKRLKLRGRELPKFISKFDEATRRTVPGLKREIDRRANELAKEDGLFGTREARSILQKQFAQRVQDRVRGKATQALLPQQPTTRPQGKWQALKQAVRRLSTRPEPSRDPNRIPDRQLVVEKLRRPVDPAHPEGELHPVDPQALRARNAFVVELTAATTARRLNVLSVKSAQHQAQDVIDQSANLRRPNHPGFVRPSQAAEQVAGPSTPANDEITIAR